MYHSTQKNQSVRQQRAVVGATGNTEDETHSMFLIFALESRGQLLAAPFAADKSIHCPGTVLWGSAAPQSTCSNTHPTPTYRGLCANSFWKTPNRGFTYTHGACAFNDLPPQVYLARVV